MAVTSHNQTASESDFGSEWLCQTLAKMDPIWKQASVQESSGLLLANTSEPSRIECELDLACLQGYSLSIWPFCKT